MVEKSRLTRDELLALSDEALIRECEVDLFRASGPGGQKRNKTSSGVRLRHLPTGVMVTATEDRSQHVNRAKAIRRIRRTLAFRVRIPIDPAAYTRSEAIASCIRRDGRLTVGKRDVRYAMVVAEVLDLLEVQGGRISDTAKTLGISTANLVSFLSDDPNLWQVVNELRGRHALKPLRQT